MRASLKFIGICISIAVAVYILKTDATDVFFLYLQNFELLGSFVAGFFFTSVFTAAPAVAVLAEIMRETAVWQVALIGGFGAALGDILLLVIIHKSVDAETKYLLGQPRFGRFKKIFETRLFHRLSFFVGALIIASPLPDELGLALIGVNHISKTQLFCILFIMNSLGIAITGYAVIALIF
ncbi:MAG: hypothetical protein NUW02_02510 [Candidatus Campbellbacteria bacterium]|nr:hypothetical protein [Candidatus Campbellbacteria bacterium]